MARIPLPGPKSLPGDKKRRLDLAALYAELPVIACAGKCAESGGPVFMSRVEWQAVCRAGGERHADALTEREHHHQQDRLVGGEPVARSDSRSVSALTCPYLENERCSVYEVRPMLCRLWGVVESMECPWGCRPERYLTRDEGYAFLARAAEIS
jgi:Fe-S-cluster containining protein